MPVAATLKKMSLPILTLALVATAYAQMLAGARLVEALQRGGYVIVMRHASSPLEPPTKEAANPDNPGDERQLDARGMATATEMGKAIRALNIPIGEVCAAPPIGPWKRSSWRNWVKRVLFLNSERTARVCR